MGIESSSGSEGRARGEVGPVTLVRVSPAPRSCFSDESLVFALRRDASAERPENAWAARVSGRCLSPGLPFILISWSGNSHRLGAGGDSEWHRAAAHDARGAHFLLADDRVTPREAARARDRDFSESSCSSARTIWRRTLFRGSGLG